jgi:hypothetical protein
MNRRLAWILTLSETHGRDAHATTLRRGLVICRECFNLARNATGKILNAADSKPPAALSGPRERKIVLLLCCAAAVHAFIFSAAFPFFNNVDEQYHFDLVEKYSQGDIPRDFEKTSAESARYIVIYGSLEYFADPGIFPDGRFPPPTWTWPLTNKKFAQAVDDKEIRWQSGINYECSQSPFYYVLAGFWWHLGQWLGFEGGRLLYWLRFLDILFVVSMVWLGHAAARMIFPENFFVRLGVPALLAFMPQTAFYSVNNDVLSPLCFGAAFFCLVKLLRAEIPDARMGIFTGLALASVFLAKISNLPLLAIAFAAVLLKITRLAKSGKLRASLPSLTSLFLCAGLPMAVWLAWCKNNFGDFTGTAAKIHMLTWTIKPFDELRHHPIFTPHGLWTFLSGLLATFWQGEFWWHRQPMGLPAVDIGYTILSICLVGAALIGVAPRSSTATALQRDALWLGFYSFIAAIAFLGLLSIIYDFHDCFYPSRDHPYFTSGRLMLGALIPFLLLFVFGIDRALKKFGDSAKFLALAAMILFMLVSEIFTDWPVFSSQYNWFHL